MSHSPSRRCPSATLFLVGVLFGFILLGLQTGLAASATWSAAPGSGDWNTSTNWVPASVPNGSSDIAAFATSTQTAVSLSANTEVSEITLGASASAYTISLDSGLILTISGAGITNNSGITQHFVTDLTSNVGAGTEIVFINSATAGSGIVFTNNTSALSTSGNPPTVYSGHTRFWDTSNAGSATFINNAATGSALGGGVTVFRDNSSAASGIFTNRGGKSGGTTLFLDNATAGNSTITSEGGTAANSNGGYIEFGGNSSAGNATLIADDDVANAWGGVILFFDDSTGGTSRIELSGSGPDVSHAGKLDIGQHNLPGVTIGSLEGYGLVSLGDENLIVGSNGLSTTFSGVFQGDGGLLTKIGTGTLTLSGVSIEGGGLEVKEGTLIVSGTYQSHSDPVTVDGGATLSGNGTIQLINGGGQVNGGTLINNGTLAPGDSLGQLTADSDVQLGYSSNLSFEIGGTTPATDYDVFTKSNATALTLNGKLTVTLSNGFTPQPSDTFAIVTTQTTLAGSFTNVKSGGRMNTVDGSGSFRVTYSGINNVVLSDFGAALSPSRSRNISSRANVQTGENVAIGGFVIKGSEAKKVIVRGLGPSLQNFGIQNPLSNPTLELHNQSGVIASNDDWQDSQQTEIQNTGFAPGNELESAIVATLQPGSYSVVLSGKDDGTGIGLIEIYDLSPAANAQLANISTRALVGTGDDVMIGGVNVGPPNANGSTLLVRALGPSLQAFGVQNFLADPVLELHDAQGNLFALNDNWKDTQQTDIAATHFSPSNDAESAILVTLAPGAWTAVVRGAGDTSGVALVEVYKF